MRIGGDMSTTPNQNGELVTFLVILAVILVVVIVVAAIALYRRKQRGLTVQNSTFGNEVNGSMDQAIPPDRRSPAVRGDMNDEHSHATTSRNTDDRRSGA